MMNGTLLPKFDDGAVCAIDVKTGGIKGVLALDKAETALLPLPKAGTALLLQNDFFQK